MTMVAKVFKNGRSQAIRIPKEFRVDSDEVFIDKEGDTLIIRPKKKDRLERFFKALKDVNTSGFLLDRNQPPLQERKLF